MTRGPRTQGLNSSTRWTGQTQLTNSQAAAHESWLVRCSTHALGFSGSNPENSGGVHTLFWKNLQSSVNLQQF